MQHNITKIRSILMTCFVVCAVIVFATASSTATTLTDTWEGTVEIPGQPLGIIVHLEETDDGALQGTADIPMQGAFHLALHQFEREGNTIDFSFVDIPASFFGELDDDMQTITGTFVQSGMEFPFVLKREAQSEQRQDDRVTLDLDVLREYVQQAMEDWSIPGVALAVVHDGELIVSEGFGWRDVENNLPVTERTLFGIGSVTKSFTATAFQMLVDEGLLSWDEPIRERIPQFKLHDTLASDRITPRDFALHRSGLPRHDMLWLYNERFDLEKLLVNAHHLAPSADFRSMWIYNNFGYAVLGHLIEQATGQPYAVALDNLLLQPLRMNDTNFTIEAMHAEDDFARAYVEQDGKFVEVTMREFGGISAAGAINSNINDMAQWLLFHLQGGEANGEQLVSDYGMHMLHSPHITLPGGGASATIRFPSYGLGWMVDSYRNYYRIHHGGNTLGYSAHVAIIPEQNFGVVVLANTSSALPELLGNAVLDMAFGYDDINWSGDWAVEYASQMAAFSETIVDQDRVQGTSPTHALSEYVGVYEHPAYGRLTIEEDDGLLKATYYDASFVIEHWHYNQFRGEMDPVFGVTIPFYFQTNARGQVNTVEVGMEPTVDPIPFRRIPNQELAELSYLSQFVGDYETMGLQLEVVLRGKTLILTVPGQPPYTLQPVKEYVFDIQDLSDFGVEFIADEEGRIERAILIQPHGNVEVQKK